MIAGFKKNEGSLLEKLVRKEKKIGHNPSYVQ
jgi:hypothetical protein